MANQCRLLCFLLFVSSVLLNSTSIEATSPPVPLPSPTDVRFLLPVVLRDYSGRYDSLWTTRLFMYNGTSTELSYLPNWVAIQDLNEPYQISLPPRSTAQPYVRGSHPGSQGVVMYVRAPGDSGYIHPRLELMEVSSGMPSNVVEIPVLSERDFESETVQLVGVVRSATSRVMLRLYEVELVPHSQFSVKLFLRVENQEDLLVAQTQLDIDASYGYFYKFAPGYAALDFDALAPYDGTYRIEVTSLTAGTKFWAFASITNNRTQDITLVTPSQGQLPVP